jgi:hypothetical protein
MMLQYDRLWPDHPFRFRIPYQDRAGSNSDRREYILAPGATPAEIPAAVLTLLADLDDNEWVYWCSDDKYPIQLVVTKIRELMTDLNDRFHMSGLLFCRSRVTLDQPKLTLYPGERKTSSGEILLERKSWYQIWIHQFLKVKVLRHFFTQMPRQLSSAKAMDDLKSEIPKPDEFHLFVTRENFAVFGESTQRGSITRNCLESIRRTDIELPDWFRRSNGRRVTIGELPEPRSSWEKWKTRLFPL